MLDDKFKFELVKKDGTNFVFLNGIIDEDTKFDKLKEIESPLVLNFKDVTSINSLGVRNWVNLMKEMQEKQIFYAEATPLIVRQLNMIPSFLGNAKVLSAYAMYVCDNCEHEKLVMLNGDEFESAGEKLEQLVQCDSCGKEEMELDGDADQYFAFAA